jgi:hypothetical protein
MLPVKGGEGSTVRAAAWPIQTFPEGMMIMTTRTAIAAVLVVGLAAFIFPAPVHAGGATQEPISGTISPPTGGSDGDVWTTPGGIQHEQGSTAVTEFTGDIEGTVTFFYKRVHLALDGSHLVSKGPFEGEVTWDGRTGVMAGMFTTECKAETVPFDFSCDGTMVGHGSGDLDGVKFHMNWGPGIFPFPYEGFALDPHGG